jgi:hypothetical protein
MSTPVVSARVVVAVGVLLGVSGDMLLRTSGLGLGFSVWVALVAAAVLGLHGGRGRPMGWESTLWIGLGVLYAAAVSWRDSPALALLAMGSAATCFALPATRGGTGPVRGGSVGAYLAAVVTTGLNAAFGVRFALQHAQLPRLLRPEDGGPGRRVATAVGWGVVIALPLLVVFGGLFASADAVFAALVADAVHVDFASVTSHAVVAGVLAWITGGYLYGSLTAGRAQPVAGERLRVLGITETAVVIGLLDVLFLCFVVVQFRYLFGGSALIDVTPGLTYAEYARRGFFELVFAVALVLPLLLAADALLKRRGSADEYVFRAFAGLQVLLVLAVTASALERMRLYLRAYGLTEQRFHATALLLLIAAVLVWFAATVLRGRRRRFAFGAVLAGLATVAVLHAVNPDAIIVRTNVARHAAAAAAGHATAFDAAYATSLGGDAVPVLIAAMPVLPDVERCIVARRLLRRWPPAEGLPLRSWSWSEFRARDVVRAHVAALRAAAGTGESCGA